MLITTLPPAYGAKNEALAERMLSHPLVGAVRYNTGIDSPYSPKETLEKFFSLASRYGKPFYLDLKGRQLRIKEWATMPYGPCVLNHTIRVKLPATVMFRGDDSCEIVDVVDGNKLYVEPLPKYPVGRGQSINILSEKLEIEENLTENDLAYIKASVKLGIDKFMLSFVEGFRYIMEFEQAIRSAAGKIEELVLKIESAAGVQFVKDDTHDQLQRYRLMAARDDLMNEIGVLNMLPALKEIIAKDPNAICASRLLTGLEQNGRISMADLSDLTLMEQLGYEHFMLSDGISQKHFDKAMEFWEAYIAK